MFVWRRTALHVPFCQPRTVPASSIWVQYRIILQPQKYESSSMTRLSTSASTLCWWWSCCGPMASPTILLISATVWYPGWSWGRSRRHSSFIFITVGGRPFLYLQQAKQCLSLLQGNHTPSYLGWNPTSNACQDLLLWNSSDHGTEVQEDRPPSPQQRRKAAPVKMGVRQRTRDGLGSAQWSGARQARPQG